MQCFEREVLIPKHQKNQGLLDHFKKETLSSLNKEKLLPIRLIVTNSLGSTYKCEVSVLDTKEDNDFTEIENLFKFEKRLYENTKNFNVVLLIPTGIDCEIGGHAGDATPVARLLATSCDHLILHPNVCNASDINEMPENSLYVEGGVISRLMMGTIGLQPTRSNRILAIIDKNKHTYIKNIAINAINAARATLGIDCLDIIELSHPLSMTSNYSSSKRAVGYIENLDILFSTLKEYKSTYDALAISSIIKVPQNYHADYFQGSMINPWGGIEAMLTHALSYKLNIPSAHAPMCEAPEIANMDPGIVDARMSAEAISTSFFYSVLKGLYRSPKIITNKDIFYTNDILSVKDISCLIIPEGCLGIPTLAALEQGIKVIAVKENKNLMQNNLSDLPWAKGQFIQVDNYLEATGVLNVIKSGISPSSVKRPLNTLKN